MCDIVQHLIADLAYNKPEAVIDYMDNVTPEEVRCSWIGVLLF
jgi:hypothetical protein